MSIQYNSKPNTGDNINSLPVDKNPPNEKEVYIIDSLFQKKSTFNSILEDSKDVLVISIIITILSMPQISEIIRKLIPFTANSDYILYFAKGIIGGFVYWLIKYFYLSRK